MFNNIKRLIKLFLLKDILKKEDEFIQFLDRYKPIADKEKIGKAYNNIERFREIISDPLNLLIKRVPEAGYMNEKLELTLHNGNIVCNDRESSYYGAFSDILMINRGVHEPLEEFCFQELLKEHVNQKEKNLIMLELGAYWGHYSMWFKSFFPNAKCFLVDSNIKNLNIGKKNFEINSLEANFINQSVLSNDFTIDDFFKNNMIEKIFLLHSDIQGLELEMLQNSKLSLKDKLIDYLMISTHSGKLHMDCIDEIKKHNYEIDIVSEPDFHSTAQDGFILARKKNCRPIRFDTNLMGRVEIANSSPENLIDYLSKIKTN